MKFMKDLISILCLLSVPIVKVIIVLIIIACLLPDGILKDIVCFITALLIFFGIIVGFILFCVNFFK